MLILIVEGLTCICTINYLLAQIMMLRTMPVCLIAASANIVFCSKCLFYPILKTQYHCIPVSSHHFLFFFHITVKSKCWMEKMSTTNYCQLWSQSLRKSMRPPPPPALSSGPLVSQSWALQPCQPVRQTFQTYRQTLQRTSSLLDVLCYCMWGNWEQCWIRDLHRRCPQLLRHCVRKCLQKCLTHQWH